MQKLRELLTLAAILVFWAVSIAAAVEVIRQPLPTSTEVDFKDLDLWLATHDLAQEPQGTRLKIAGQLERESRHLREWQEQLEKLSEPEQAQFSQNFALLTEAWFFNKVDEYTRCRPERRDAYINRNLSTIMSWSALGNISDSSSKGSASKGKGGKRRRSGMGSELGQRMQQFAATASPERQKEVMAFIDALREGFIRRTMDQMQPKVQ